MSEPTCRVFPAPGSSFWCSTHNRNFGRVPKHCPAESPDGLAALRTRVAELEAVLKKYGRHVRGCSGKLEAELSASLEYTGKLLAAPCSCGFAEALSVLAHKEEE